MKEGFNFKQELRNIFEKELLGKTNAGRIYRKLLARDREFIKIISDWVKEHIKEGKKINPKDMLHAIKCGAGDNLK